MEEKYLNIKDFAKLVNKSEQGIYQRLSKENNILNKYVKVEEGQKFISIEAAKEIYKVDIEEAAAAGESTEEPSRCHHEANTAADSKLIEILEKELEIKNKQIADLNDRLSEVTKTLDQQQQLAAIDKKRILELEDLTKKQEQNNENTAENNDKPDKDNSNTEKKKGFFAKLFNK